MPQDGLREMFSSWDLSGVSDPSDLYTRASAFLRAVRRFQKAKSLGMRNRHLLAALASYQRLTGGDLGELRRCGLEI